MQQIKEFDYSFADGSNIFFTSDTHFGHSRIIDFCNRPFNDVEEMNQKLIKNWNAKIPKDGIVFHLGDFFFGGSAVFYEIISQLNGRIYLCTGNHDRHNFRPAYNDFFEDISYKYYIKVEGQKILMLHEPLLCYSHCYGDYNKLDWQLFGHVHSGPLSTGADDARLKYLLKGQYDVGVDNNNFTPISFYELKEKLCVVV